MSNKKPVVVYGASGYTGRLICEYLRELGLPVGTDMPKEVLELMTLYPQPVRRQSTEIHPRPGNTPAT